MSGFIKTHDEADQIMKSDVPDDLLTLKLVCEYRGASRKKYYTRFSLLRTNEYLNKKPNLKFFTAIQ